MSSTHQLDLHVDFSAAKHACSRASLRRPSSAAVKFKIVTAVERHQVREVLKCLLHTILFNRALGLVRPRDMHLQLLDLTYVECGDDAVDAKVNAALAATDTFMARSLPSASQPSTSRRQPADEYSSGPAFQVRLSFYEATTKQGLLSTYEHRFFWETWIIRMRLLQYDTSRPESRQERDDRQRMLQEGVNDVMTHIVHVINNHKDHIPPVQDKSKLATTGPLTYPFEIQTIKEAPLRDSILGTVSRLFTSTSAPVQPSYLH